MDMVVHACPANYKMRPGAAIVSSLCGTCGQPPCVLGVCCKYGLCVDRPCRSMWCSSGFRVFGDGLPSHQTAHVAAPFAGCVWEVVCLACAVIRGLVV